MKQKFYSLWTCITVVSSVHCTVRQSIAIYLDHLYWGCELFLSLVISPGLVLSFSRGRTEDWWAGEGSQVSSPARWRHHSTRHRSALHGPQLCGGARTGQMWAVRWQIWQMWDGATTRPAQWGQSGGQTWGQGKTPSEPEKCGFWLILSWWRQTGRKDKASYHQVRMFVSIVCLNIWFDISVMSQSTRLTAIVMRIKWKTVPPSWVTRTVSTSKEKLLESWNLRTWKRN